MLAEHNRSNMKKNNLICFVQSLVILPVMTMPVVFPAVYNTEISQNVLAQKFNISPVRGSLAEVLQIRDLVASETSNGIHAYIISLSKTTTKRFINNN